MKKYHNLLKILSIQAFLSFSIVDGFSQDTDFVYDFDPPVILTGEGVTLGGILTPVLYGITTVGAFESGADAQTFSTNEHDPQVDAGVQSLEASIFLNINDVITGRITGFGYEGEDDWEAEVEEYFLHFNPNPNISIGGGQFLNFFGFQSHRHLHGWDFVNNNLTNARMINEGELVTQGGKLILRHPDRFAMLSLGAGGVRSHAHEEEEHGGGGGGGHGHEIEADRANFNDWVATADLKWAIGGDPSAMGTASLGVGENGFGEMTYLYGIGIQKVWGGRESAFGAYHELAPGGFMIRTELIGREIDAIEVDHGDKEQLELDEQGVSASLFYGLSDNAILSFRYDSVTGVEEFETEDHQRLSPALTMRFGPNRRLQTRVQYDYNDSDGIGEEHVGWLQFQYQWGRTIGGYWGD